MTKGHDLQYNLFIHRSFTTWRQIMSKKVINPRIIKKVDKNKKNSQFIEYSLIEYNEDQFRNCARRAE